MKIYLKNPPEFKTPKDIIHFLYQGISDTKEATYLNEECTRIQCQSGVYRSLEDLTDIISTYFPDFEIVDLVGVFLEINRCTVHYCKDINRCTYAYSECGQMNISELQDNQSHYENAWDDEEYEDFISFENWMDFVDILDLIEESGLEEKWIEKYGE
jgi:hypothetical protein